MPTPGSIDADYVRWKTLVPFLYDWFAHHRVVWPSLSCRWGAVLERNEFKHKQRLYLSEQTDGSASHPNTLVVCNVDVVKRRVAAAESMIFEEESRSAFVKSWKKIIHPGEVNKMREFESRPELLVTHTDAPELLFWNTDTQPHRKTTAAASSAPAAPAGAKAPALDAQSLAPSKPDLVLVGHEENAEFALAVRRDAPDVASGGKDQKVLLWSIEDHDAAKAAGKSGAPRAAALYDGAPELAPKLAFAGHEDTVEDVAFHPSSHAARLCSVACDRSVIFWDGRAGTAPAHRIESAHADDLHTVDWSLLDEHAVVTGGADGLCKLWDARRLSRSGDGCVVRTFDAHAGPITTVQWCPDQRGVFASGAEDGYLNVWDVGRGEGGEGGEGGRGRGVGGENAGAGEGGDGAGRDAKPRPAASSALVFQHAGHRSQVSDFQWNPFDPWTIASVSSGDGGNTLQMWRVNDLIHRPEEEALAELEKHKAVICGVKLKERDDEEGAPGNDPDAMDVGE